MAFNPATVILTRDNLVNGYDFYLDASNQAPIYVTIMHPYVFIDTAVVSNPVQVQGKLSKPNGIRVTTPLQILPTTSASITTTYSTGVFTPPDQTTMTVFNTTFNFYWDQPNNSIFISGTNIPPDTITTYFYLCFAQGESV